MGIKFRVITLIIFGMVMVFTGIVCADQGVPQVPEIQGLVSTTTIVCEGTVLNSGALEWQLTDEDVNDAGLATRGIGSEYMLGATQVQYSSAYDANTIAQHGQTTFIKQMAVGTGNKLLTQSNVKTLTETAFMATGDGGNILGTENLMLDGVGNTTNATDRILCPFISSGHRLIPSYCNIVQMGSKYDLTIGSVVTASDDRFVGIDADTPVLMNYNINVKPYTIQGQGTSPAMGMTIAFIKAHIREARGQNVTEAEDLTYSETTSASGRISSFTDEISYSSQVTPTSAGNHIIHASATNQIQHAFSTIGSAFISPSGDVPVQDHGSITFTLGTLFTGQAVSIPIDGQAYVVVDGVDQGFLHSYTFSDVTSDHTIVAYPGHPHP